MAKPIYTAQATVTGGRIKGHGRTSDGALDVQLRPPKETGGEEPGTNPEQLFAVGYAACFENAMATVARRLRMELGEVSIDSRVSLVAKEDRSYSIEVGLDVTLPGIADPDEAERFIAATHKVCPYSNATRGNIPVELTVNGRPVG